ncbi:MAG TPA: signal peptidase I [Chthonomonadaceae bacterium]|nr:signal peptidase I [Chthonomonadaceae bacterium]
MQTQNPPVNPGSPRSQADSRARREARNQRTRRRLKIIFPFLLVLVFVVYAFTTNFIPSESMLPGIKPGDHVLTMRAWLAFANGRMPARGDIITFVLPEGKGGPGGDNAASAQEQGSQDQNSEEGGRRKFFLFQKESKDVLIKRVIGLPGETVMIRGNDVYINGTKLTENYPIIPVDHPEFQEYAFATEDNPLKLGPDEVFVLGDNRNNSEDGRFWGPLKRDQIIGKFVKVLWNEGENGPNEKRARQEESRPQSP